MQFIISTKNKNNEKDRKKQANNRNGESQNLIQFDTRPRINIST